MVRRSSNLARSRLIGVHWQSCLLLLVLLALSACLHSPATSTLTPITVQLSWTHQAEFSGLYAAQQLGYFKDAGLDVSFAEGGADVDFIAPVANGTAQFGVAQPADLILARAQGKSVRSVAAIYQHSPIVFIALADSGITRPQDFVGKRIRSATTVDEVLRALMTKVGIRPDQYETVYLPSDINQFASGDVPVWTGFVNVFALQVQKAGYKINIIYPDDYGIHFYGDVLITTDELTQKNPDLVQRFTQAALKGWTYVVENPETAGKFVQQYQPKADTNLESAIMVASIPLVNTGENPIGWMQPEIWTGMAQTLHDQGVLTEPLDVQRVYTMQFLENIYSK